MDGKELPQPSTPAFVAPVLKGQFPEIVNAARFMPTYGARTIRYEDKMFDEIG